MLTEEQIKKVFDAMGTDKAKSHNYHIYYKDVLNSNPKSLLEIGVKQGKSLAAWRALVPGIQLYGLDITKKNFDQEYIKYSEARVIEADSTVQKTTSNFPTVDVIIDDGSHFYKDQIKTFEVFKGKFKNIYVIEDVLYKLDEVVDSIKSHGFTDIQVCPSKTKNVPVDLNLLENNSKEESGTKINIDLHMIIIRK